MSTCEWPSGAERGNPCGNSGSGLSSMKPDDSNGSDDTSAEKSVSRSGTGRDSAGAGAGSAAGDSGGTTAGGGSKAGIRVNGPGSSASSSPVRVEVGMSAAAVTASSRRADAISCSANRASSLGDAPTRKPAANWCSMRRISSAVSTNRRASSGVPWPIASERISACSSVRDRLDRSVKPTVAELPASECASAIGISPIGRCSSIAHSASSVVRRRDNSSASFR